MAQLTDEEIAREDEFLKGLPRFNIGAFLLPPIWGAAHGFWVTSLFYPAWLFIDNLLYAAYTSPTPLALGASISAVLGYIGITAAFAIVSQPIAAHRAEDRGIGREQYLRRQRWWAIGCAAGAAAMLVLATVYNLTMRPAQ